MAAFGNTISHVGVACANGDARMVVRVAWRINAADKKSSRGIDQSLLCQTRDLLVVVDGAAECDVLEAAWLLGAWDAVRTERMAIPATKNAHEPRWGIESAFRGCPYSINGDSLSIGDDGGQDDLIAMAAASGWIAWAFKPTKWSSRVGSNNDKTLLSDGSRQPRDTLITPAPLTGRAHQHIYRLGRAPHGNRSKNRRSRNA